MRRILAVLMLSSATLPVSIPNALATVASVSSCGTVISASGKYSLSNDLLACPGTAVTIAVSGVSLNLNGYEISCDSAGGPPTAGILSVGVSDVDVRNGQISSCDNGVQFLNVSDSKIVDLTVRNGGAGIFLLGSDNNEIFGNSLAEGILGIGVFNSDDNKVIGNLATGNNGLGPTVFGMGIALSGFSSGNTLKGNTTTFNSDAGIVLSVGVVDNVVQGNDVQNNAIYGIGAFTRVDLGTPPPANNLIQGNTVLASGLADLVEILFDPFGNPRESIDVVCRNTWKGNEFVSLIGPLDCVQ